MARQTGHFIFEAYHGNPFFPGKVLVRVLNASGGVAQNLFLTPEQIMRNCEAALAEAAKVTEKERQERVADRRAATRLENAARFCL